MRPALFVTDLDGTFVDAVGEVSAVNRSALQLAADCGVPVVVATGRPSRWLGVLDGLPGLHQAVVVSNGAGVFDRAAGTHSQINGLDPQVGLEVAHDLRAAIPGMTFAFEWGEHFGCEPGLRQERGEWLRVGPLEELAREPEPVLKLCGFHDELGSDELAARGRPVIGDRLTMTHSHMGEYGLLEISAPGVTKASALAGLCAELGVRASESGRVRRHAQRPADAGRAGRGYAIAQGHPLLLQAGFARTEGPQDEAVGRMIVALLS